MVVVSGVRRRDDGDNNESERASEREPLHYLLESECEQRLRAEQLDV